MATDRLSELEQEKEYDKIDDAYQIFSEIIEQLYKEGSTVDPETHAFLKRQKDSRFAPVLPGMRKRTVPLDLDDFDYPIEGGRTFPQELDEYAELNLADGGRIGDIEQEIMQSDYDEELAKVLKLADEDPGLQEFSLAAPAAKLRALSQLLSTGVSKVGAMIPQGAKEALEGLPSIMQSRGRRGGTGKGFEQYGKRRGGTTSRVNQNLDGLISKFMAETRGGTDLGGASPYTIELLRASLPEIRAAAARTKQNPKHGLNRVLQLLDELE